MFFWWLFLVNPILPFFHCGKYMRQQYPNFRIPLSFFAPVFLFLFALTTNKFEDAWINIWIGIAILSFIYPLWIYRKYELEFKDQRFSRWKRYLSILEKRQVPKLRLKAYSLLGVLYGSLFVVGFFYISSLALGFPKEKFPFEDAMATCFLIYILQIFHEYKSLKNGTLVQAIPHFETSKINSAGFSKLVFDFAKGEHPSIQIRGILYAQRRLNPSYFVGKRITPLSLLLEDALMRWDLKN